MRILIRTIKHHQQRYDTVGDWEVGPNGTLVISVSSMGDERYEELVAVHELLEALLCLRRGITADMVDQFDMAYESRRQGDDDSEPGDDPHAPYRKEHFFATSIERLLAAEYNVDWQKYDETVNTL